MNSSNIPSAFGGWNSTISSASRETWTLQIAAKALTDNIQARRSCLDLLVHRRCADRSQQQFRISGEPVIDGACGFAGSRGLGVEVRAGRAGRAGR